MRIPLVRGTSHLPAPLVFLAAALITLAFASRAEAFVYWANDPNDSGTTIGRANLDGTGVNQSFITDPSSPHNLAVDGAHIYWANCGGLGCPGTTIGRANLDGTGVNQSFITGASGASGVAVDATHIYWANISDGTIGRANLDGTGVNQSFITGASGPHSIAVDAAHIYWSNFGGTTIGRANLDGTGVNQSFITGASLPTGVAVDSAHIYWSNFGSGASGTTIGRANLDGTGVNQSFITGASAPNGLAVDGAHIYWGNCADGSCSGTTIGRANLDGTGVNQSFISGVSGPSGIAVDSLTPAPPNTEGPPGDATCSDGVDNDGDGLIDGADPDCAAPAATSGSSPPPVDQTLRGDAAFTQGTSNDLYLACTKLDLLLIDVLPAGAHRVSVTGTADLRLAGQTAEILLDGKRVGTAAVGADGSFATRVAAPSGRRRRSARYQARIGATVSQRLKLERRMVATTLTRSGSTLVLRGRITKPLTRRPATIEVERFLSCSRRQKLKLARVFPDRRGDFAVRIPVPAGARAAIYRALTKVSPRPGAGATARTFTLPRAIDLT